MAKRISDEEIRLNIIINGDTAQKELYEQEKNIRDLNAAQKELRKEKQLLEKQGLKDSERYRAVTASMKENTAEIAKSKARMKELQDQIGLTGLTMNQLRSEALRLRLTLNNLVPGSAEYQQYEQDLSAVNDRMAELRGNGQQAGFSLGAMADGFNRYAGLIASVIAGLTGMVLSIQKVLDMNGKLADAQTNVQKTTGMTKREVDELTKSFGLLKTRTGRIELLGIAEIGGRLGIAKNEIADFVKVMDKSAVALGDSFEGGPDVVAEKLGRIKGLYEELKNVGVEEAFESVGSALNDLGADGTASEQNLAEFAQRVGTLPGKLKPSIQTALGLGAAFEESGLKAELAGNNYGKVISIAARDTAAFAKVMNRPVAELEKMINTDPTEFFLQFAQSLKGLDATDLAKVLDYLKLNDNEVKMVLGAASDNVDVFRDKIKLAGESMAEASSLTEEYNLKNNNLAATLDRIKKRMVGWFTSDGFVAWLESAVNWLARFIGAIDDTDGKASTWRNSLVFTAKIIAVVTAAIVTNVGWMKLCALWTARNTQGNLLYNIGLKARAATEAIATVSTRALILVQNLLTLNVRGTIQAFRALSMAMKSNPFGLILSVVSAVVAAMILFRKESKGVVGDLKKVSNETDVLAKRNALLEESFAKGASAIRSKVEPLINILKDQNTHLATRKVAYERLIAINPEFIGTVDKEFMATKRLDEVYSSLLENLRLKMRAEANQKTMQGFYDAEANAIQKVIKLEQQLAQYRQKEKVQEGNSDRLIGTDEYEAARLKYRDMVVEGDRIEAQLMRAKDDLEKVSNDLGYAENWRNSEVKRLEAELEGLKEGTKKYIEVKNELTSLLGQVADEPVKARVIDADAEKKAKKDAEDLKKQRQKWADEQRKLDMDNAKNLSKELLELQEREIDERIALKLDGFDKERQMEAENHTRKMLDLKKQLTDETVLANLDARIEDPETKKLDRAYLYHYKEQLLLKNSRINNLIETEEDRHRLAISTINDKQDTDRIQKMQAQYEREGVLAQTDFNNQMAALGSNEIAKQNLQKNFDKKEIERQAQHLNKLIDEKEKLLKELNARMDLTALTPDQLKALQDEIDKLKLALSELAKAKSDLKKDEGSDDISSAGRGALRDTDILGFTPDQWEQLYANIDNLEGMLRFAGAAIQGMQNLWGMYNNFVAANENRQLSNYEKTVDKKKKALKSQLDNGYISQSQYQKLLEQLDNDLDRKRQDIEYKQAKRQKTQALFEAAINTAKGITAAIPNLFLMALAASAGALQVATIAKQPLPARGYEEGLYPDHVIKREQDGKLFNARYGGRTRSGLVRKPTYFLAGENGPEMVIDARAYRQMSPGTRDLLIRELRGIKGFEKGYYNSDVTGAPRLEVPQAGLAQQSSVVSQEYLLAVIDRNSAIMEKLLEQGVTAWIARDYRNYKDLNEDLERFKNSRNKAKQ